MNTFELVLSLLVYLATVAFVAWVVIAHWEG